MKRPPEPLRREWDRRLSAEGLGVLGDDRHWTLPGVTAKGVGFVSLSSLDSGGSPMDASGLFEADNMRAFGKVTPVASTPVAVFFRKFSAAVAKLADDHPYRPLLMVYAETGYIVDAARAARMDRHRASRILHRFAVQHRLPWLPLAGAHFETPDRDVCQECDSFPFGPHSPHGRVKTEPPRNPANTNAARKPKRLKAA